jgi:hypothetical protein
LGSMEIGTARLWDALRGVPRSFNSHTGYLCPMWPWPFWAFATRTIPLSAAAGPTSVSGDSETRTRAKTQLKMAGKGPEAPRPVKFELDYQLSTTGANRAGSGKDLPVKFVKRTCEGTPPPHRLKGSGPSRNRELTKQIIKPPGHEPDTPIGRGRLGIRVMERSTETRNIKFKTSRGSLPATKFEISSAGTSCKLLVPTQRAK